MLPPTELTLSYRARNCGTFNGIDCDPVKWTCQRTGDGALVEFRWVGRHGSRPETPRSSATLARRPTSRRATTISPAMAPTSLRGWAGSLSPARPVSRRGQPTAAPLSLARRACRIDFPTHFEDVLLLGDPGARDAALHALQACIPHLRVLPVKVERIRLGQLAADRSYTVHATEVARDKDRFVFDLDIREDDGSSVERWEGLELRVVEPLPDAIDWPIALARPFLERRLGELLPAAALRIDLARECREKRRTDDMLGALLGQNDGLQRRSDGKPEAEEGISASHAGNLTFAVAANGPVGCDIETVVDRQASTWRDLLGAERF
jgi:hypothetical protein